MKELYDLGLLVEETRGNLQQFEYKDFCLSKSFKKIFKEIITASGSDVEFEDTTAIISNSAGQKIYAPNQWFVLAAIAVPLAKEVMRYREYTERYLDKRFDDLKKISPSNIKEKKDVYQIARAETDKDQLKMTVVNGVTSIFEQEFKVDGFDEESAIKNTEYLVRFITDSKWWLGGKGLERKNDYYVSPVLGVLNLVNASQSYVATLTYLYANNENFLKEVDSIVEREDESDDVIEFINEYERAANIVKFHIEESGLEFSETKENIEECRNDLLKYFSPEKLASLSDNEILKTMYYTNGDNSNSLCYWLEMVSESRSCFGSIAGGSAYKFGLFQKKDTGIWMTGSSQKPKELTDDEAVELGKQLRDALVLGVDIIKKSKLDSFEAYEQLDDELKEKLGIQYYNLAWFHKYFSIVCPDKLSGFHNNEWQYHVLYCFGIKPSGKYYARSGQIAMIENFAGIPYRHLIDMIKDKFGTPKLFVRLGTSDDESNYAAEWRHKSVAGIGWPKVGSLEEYIVGGSIDKTLLAEKLCEEYYTTDKKTASRKAGELVRFYNADDNTVFVAMDGQKLIALIDQIGAYHYDGNSNMPHLKPGKWNMVFSEGDKLPVKSEGKLTSCYQITDEENVMYLYKKYYYEEEADNLEIDKKSEEEKDLKTCLEINREPRKQKIYPINFIVYGAPGTGKTYSMVEYALAIIDNETIDEFRKKNPDRKENVARYKELIKAKQIVFTTFHQNYGYEEFIQGLRPDKNSDKMAFKTVDGVFKVIADTALNDDNKNYVIIIDEINRANISKVFGELITLIEEDKRWGELNETSATLQSGDPFAVPNNLYIVGTMNSADKSISLIDAALRRRFDFIEQKPDPELVPSGVLRKIFEKINKDLVKRLESTDLLVGHSYFMGKDESDLCGILNNNIIPLLYEYFYDDRNKVASIIIEAIKESDAKIEIVDEEFGRLKVKEKVE